MENKTIILITCGFLIIIVLFATTSSLLLTYFNNTLTVENITFVGNQNILNVLEVMR